MIKEIIDCEIAPSDWSRIEQLAEMINCHATLAGWHAPRWAVTLRDRRGRTTFADSIAEAKTTSIANRRAVWETELRIAETPPSSGAVGREVIVLLKADQTGQVEVSAPSGVEAVGLARRTVDFAPSRRFGWRSRRQWRWLRARLSRLMSGILIGVLASLIVTLILIVFRMLV